MKGSEAITDDVWKMLVNLQTELSAFFYRVQRLPRETVDDCVLDAVTDAVAEYDPVYIATEANRLYVKPETIIATRLKELAQKRIRRAERLARKHVSDDTPIGEEDGDMRLRDLFIPKQNSAERMENYAEWKMFARKGGCPLSSEEIEDLFGFNTPVWV